MREGKSFLKRSNHHHSQVRWWIWGPPIGLPFGLKKSKIKILTCSFFARRLCRNRSMSLRTTEESMAISLISIRYEIASVVSLLSNHMGCNIEMQISCSKTCGLGTKGHRKTFQMSYSGEEDVKFVIIGGDAAGMSAASRAKRIRADMDVIVLEESGDVSYSA